MPRRLHNSPQTRAVLGAFSARPTDWRYGYDLLRETGLKSGTLYPLLMRLEDQGLLEAEWRPAEERGRPPRHAYRLTGHGLRVAAEMARPSASPGLHPVGAAG